MRFYFVPLAAFCYVLLRTILPARIHPLAKVLFALAAFLPAARRFFQGWLLDGTVFPEAPAFVFVLLAILCTCLIFFFALSLVRDAGLLLAALARRLGAAREARAGDDAPAGARFDRPDTACLREQGLFSGFRRLSGQLDIVLLFVAVFLAVVCVDRGCAVPEVHRVEVELAGSHAALDGLKVVQLSDLHLSAMTREGWLESVTDRVMEEKPDLIVLTGDLADGPVSRRAEDLAGLSALKAPLGVFAVTGNHEYNRDWPALRQAVPSGIRWLCNESVVLKGPGGRFALAGIPDSTAARGGDPKPDPAKALAGVPRDMPAILLSHRPKAARKAARLGVAVQLSGHTHGGQLFFAGPLVAGPNGGFVRGLYRVGGLALYVSSGCAQWAGFSARFFVPTEIAVLTFRARKEDSPERAAPPLP